jgi:FlaA1/EpsC-like NDP-sugar epimerase
LTEPVVERPTVGLEPPEVHEFLRGRRVLVTGAGGSIGSELCRQIARFDPAILVMLDRYENGLYAIERDVASNSDSAMEHAAVIADITDRPRLEEVFRRYQPQIVYHAAAHKHVPLMEANPCEAIKNNVFGTRVLAETAVAEQVGHFILISTDKAVNPSSVMGATKRVTELIIQSLQARSNTVFAAVRFGNVLGSNGSVVPLFLEQIRAGGPVTVTHPEVRRFFMLIPEAVQLVLHAATLARGGEVFVLEMGEQIRLLDLARSLIRQAGLRPGTDVQITFTGLRPGEKLTEELTASDELIEPSGRRRIMRVRSPGVEDPARLAGLLTRLEQSARAGDSANALATLRTVVPTFRPVGSSAPLASPRLTLVGGPR